MFFNIKNDISNELTPLDCLVRLDSFPQRETRANDRVQRSRFQRSVHVGNALCACRCGKKIDKDEMQRDITDHQFKKRQFVSGLHSSPGQLRC